MRLEPVKPENDPFMKKTKHLLLLDDFEKQNIPMAEITGWEDDYANPSSLQASVTAGIKRFKKSNIECRSIDKRVYLINKVLYEKEKEA